MKLTLVIALWVLVAVNGDRGDERPSKRQSGRHEIARSRHARGIRGLHVRDEGKPQNDNGTMINGTGSCEGFCGEMSGGCFCDEACVGFGDCCDDADQFCDIGSASGDGGSCAGHCGGQSAGACWCDRQCSEFGDCCGDKELICPSNNNTDFSPQEVTGGSGVNDTSLDLE